MREKKMKTKNKRMIKRNKRMTTSDASHLNAKGALVIEANPLVPIVGEGHLLLIVPHQCCVVLIQEVTHLSQSCMGPLNEAQKCRIFSYLFIYPFIL